MADYAGAVLGVHDSAEHAEDPKLHFRVPERDNEFHQADNPPWAFGLAGLVTIKNSRTPINEYAGSVSTGYVDDFYYRLHLAPARIDLGNILNAQTRTFYLFNGYFDTRTYHSITPVNASGLNLIDPVPAYPYDFKALEQLTYTVEVGTTGDAALNAQYLFDLDLEDLVLPITGSRVVVFGWDCNWRREVLEQYQWQTTILRRRNGTEQRFGLDARPRKSLAFEIGAYTANDAGRLRATLSGWHDRFFAVPIWSDITTLTQAASIGATQLYLDTTGLNLYIGGMAIVIQDSQHYETVEITAVSPTSIDVARAIAQDWPTGTRIAPVLFGHLPNRVSNLRMDVDTTQAGRLSFNGDTEKTDPGVTGGAATDTFKSLELVTRKPNRRRAVQLSSESDFEVVDYQRGFNRYFIRSPTETTWSYEFLLTGKADILAFKQFLGRCNGRRVPFYLPTDMADIEVVSDIGESSLGVVAKNNGYVTYLIDSQAIDGLYLTTNTGQTFARDIVGVSLDGETDLITFSIDTPLGVNVFVDDIVQVSYLMLCRLATDRIQLRYRTPEVAEVRLGVQAVEG